MAIIRSSAEATVVCSFAVQEIFCKIIGKHLQSLQLNFKLDFAESLRHFFTERLWLTHFASKTRFTW